MASPPAPPGDDGPLYLAPDQEAVPGYRLVRPLGRGGFGEVWQATGPGGFATALKIVHVGAAAHTAEQRALGLVRDLRHANLITLAGAWHRDGHLIIAMELAEGTLFDRLQAAVAAGKEGIPYEELIEYLQDVARGLDFLHQRGIQHRDVKPRNLLLVGGTAKVADFGLAKLLEHTHATNTGTLSPVYAAPEFFHNQTTPTSDQYGLALSYCELRGNRLPFRGANPFALMRQHLHDPPDLAMLPPAERPVVARALAKDPKARWPSCRAFVQALTDSTATRWVTGSAAMVGGVVLEAGAEPVPGYRLEKVLGRGSFGEVWQATGPGGFAVAIKFLNLQLAPEALAQEARALELMKNVRHAHLLSLFGTWQAEGYLIVAMELGDRTLYDRFREAHAEGHPGIPAGELRECLDEAAKGLDYLAGRGVVHRDVKPRNLLLVGGSVKVADFGLAKALHESRGRGSQALSPAYAAPEFFRGQVNTASDQFSLAATYAHLRTGRLPFPGQTCEAILARIAAADPDLEGLPAAEQAALRRALDRRPEHRWPSCRAFVQALGDAPAAAADGTPAPGLTTTREAPFLDPAPPPLPDPPALPAGEAALPPPSSHLTDRPLFLLPGVTAVPGYRLQRCRWKAADGGRQVWQAEGPGGGAVALKVVRAGGPPTGVADWAYRLAGLEHPHLLPAYGLWHVGGYLVLATELADATLAGPAAHPPPTVAAVLRAAAAALDYLHAQGLAHGNVHLGNLYRVGDRLKLGDPAWPAAFGLPGPGPPAGAADDQAGLVRVYCQLRLGPRAEVSLERFPPEERAVLERALDPEPGRRWPTCQAFVTALLAAAPAAAGRKLPTTMGKVKVAEQYAPGDVAAPGCRLERRLGHGPFGEVWQAVTALPRRVALRIFRLDQYHRLVRPFRACRGLRALQHPHLLPYYRFWLKDADGQVVDDTQDVGGLGAPVELVAATALADSSLAEALAQQPAGLPVAALIGYLEEAARALDFLNQPHRLASGQTTAFSHRGLKPGNLLLAGGRVRVADFGLSYLLQVEEGWLNLWGKAYLAPEQILDWDQHHPQADQYSLAVTYYQLRTGRLPFATTDIVAVMQDIVMGKLDLTGVPAAERAVLERATSIFPADRFPGCLALIQELTQAVPQRPDSAALL